MFPPARAAAAQTQATLRHAVAIGVPLAFGTHPRIEPHGADAKELAHRVKNGTKPADALVAVIAKAADVLGFAAATGTLAAHKAANVPAADNPFTDIHAIDHPAVEMMRDTIYLGGR